MADAKNLFIIGSGGQAKVVLDAVKLVGINCLAVIDTNYKGQKENILGCPVLGGLEILDDLDPDNNTVFVALGDNNKRADYFQQLKERGFAIPTIIHPAAIVSEHCFIGKGVFINAASILNADSQIGDNTIINSGAIIEHEVVIGKCSHIGPGVKIGGRSKIGKNAFIGIGTNVIDYITIGDHVTIGAGSVIIQDIESQATVVGSPGRKIK